MRKPPQSLHHCISRTSSCPSSSILPKRSSTFQSPPPNPPHQCHYCFLHLSLPSIWLAQARTLISARSDLRARASSSPLHPGESADPPSALWPHCFARASFLLTPVSRLSFPFDLCCRIPPKYSETSGRQSRRIVKLACLKLHHALKWQSCYSVIKQLVFVSGPLYFTCAVCYWWDTFGRFSKRHEHPWTADTSLIDKPFFLLLSLLFKEKEKKYVKRDSCVFAMVDFSVSLSPKLRKVA